MRRPGSIPLAGVLPLLLIAAGVARGQGGAALIGFDDLEHHVGHTPGAVDTIQLLDVRPRAEYEAGHVPNSIWADIRQAEEIARRPGGLTDRDAWFAWITPLNLYPNSNVRVIGNNRQLDAARAWWLLRYLGVPRVGLVDGNFDLWKAQHRPVTAEVPDVPRHAFPVDFQSDRLATRDDVLATLRSKDARVVDARTIGEWLGTDLRSKRGGHMPDACRVEWSDLVDADGKFLPVAKLRARFAAAGIQPGEAVVAHCQGGGRAAVDAFALELIGHPTRVYYLSWSDWGNADDTPITTAEAPAEAPAPGPPGSKPFTVEYDYKCKWGHADEFLELFRRNHLPVLRERQQQGDILSIAVAKPRIHTGESDRWDFRVTLVFKDAAEAFHIAADEPIKRRLFPDQVKYRAEEQRRFEILESHTDLPVEPVDLGPPATSP